MHIQRFQLHLQLRTWLRQANDTTIDVCTHCSLTLPLPSTGYLPPATFCRLPSTGYLEQVVGGFHRIVERAPHHHPRRPHAHSCHDMCRGEDATLCMRAPWCGGRWRWCWRWCWYGIRWKYCWSSNKHKNNLYSCDSFLG